MIALRRTVAAVALSSSIVSIALPAHAEGPAQAQVLFDHGIADMEAGRYDKACPAIRRSHELEPLPGTLFALAECEAKRGRLATAVRLYDDYLALYPTLPPEKKARQGERPQIARQTKAALLPQMPAVTPALPPAPPRGTRVKLDGEDVPEGALGEPMRVDPGEHVFSTQMPGGPVTETRVTVDKGEKKTVLLDVKRAAPRIEETPEPVKPGPSGRRIGAFAAGGVGVAGVLVGAITGGLALGKKSTVQANCGSGIHSQDPTACLSPGLDAANSLKTLGLASTIGFAVGAAGLVTGVVLFATEPKPKPGSRGQARWVRVEVAPLGASGAVAGVKGAW